MIGMILLQVSSFLRVVPSWLSTLTICLGIVLLFAGLINHYTASYLSHLPSYNQQTALILVGSLTGSVAGATYMTTTEENFTLLFVFVIFTSGQMIQGAVAARLIQKVIDALLGEKNVSNDSLFLKAKTYIINKAKDRALIVVSTGIISIHMILSIAAVFVIGDGNFLEAIERFWIGFLLLSITHLVFDFRYFAHRIPYTAAIGLILAVGGAIIYDPVGFSSFSAVFAPYLNNPIPNWMRAPLGAYSSFCGVVIWSIYYRRNV